MNGGLGFSMGKVGGNLPLWRVWKGCGRSLSARGPRAPLEDPGRPIPNLLNDQDLEFTPQGRWALFLAPL